MQFTKFLLDNYLATEEGAQALAFFQDLPKYAAAGDPDGRIKNFVDDLLLVPLAEEWYEFGYEVSEYEYGDFEEFSSFVGHSLHDILTEEECTYRDLVQDIPHMSLRLYAESQQFAFPYLYPVHFFRVQEICETFDIPLPPLPQKTKYEDKCLYYIKLCKVFHEFRMQHGMSPQEFCVFFYSFAQHFISQPLSDEVPAPLKSYLVGGNAKEDHQYLQTLEPSSCHYWQGNTETKPGDIVLMYELAPYSHISSIWRALSPGYDDPFRYWAGVVWLGQPVPIPPVSLEELKADPVWSQKGLVKANMQGVSGRGCSREEYAALLGILQQKGFDVSRLPALPELADRPDIPLACERDVEQYLLEPFLRQLGLTEKDWLRQMPLRMGRGIRYYPDYVIRAETGRGNEKGAFICEAKFRISSEKQLKEDFYQAKSYALRLDSGGLLLASCEGVGLSFARDDYDFKKMEFFDWQALADPDVLHGIKLQLEAVLKKKHGQELHRRSAHKRR